jgi:hypothetical protein
MGQKASVIRFNYTIGMSQQFFGDTISFQTIVNGDRGSGTQLAPFYEYGVIGFSTRAASGTFGVRFLWVNPAMARPYGAAASANVTVLNTTPVGLTGIGGSSVGLFTFIKPSTLGVGGTTQATFVGIQDHFVTPDIVEVQRTGGVSSSGSLQIAGYLMNPIMP